MQQLQLFSRRLLLLKPRPLSSSVCSIYRPQIATISTDYRSPYKHIDEVERLDNYRPGGYHPVKIGDRFQDGRFQDRYRIVHKLGYGSYSTIWLAWDEKMARYVAMKIGTAEHGCKDIDVLSRICASSTGKGRDFGSHLTPAVLDHFSIDGPNGTHPCLVTAPARCSLADAAEAAGYATFQLPIARSLASQLVMAVACIHGLGYVHGDLHTGNILFQQPKLDCLSIQQLYDKFNAPEPKSVVRVDKEPITALNIPTHVYSPVWLGKPSNKVLLSEAKLLLADFGTAFRPAEEPRFVSYTPLPIQPPEVRFEPTKPLSYASDIWSLGCVIWRILGVEPLLDCWLIGPDETTADQMDALGPMPDEWWETWEKRSEYFDGNGKPKEGREVWTLDRRFESAMQEPRRNKEMDLMGDKERDALLAMVRGMLLFRPGDRPSASQVLQTRWMKQWAIPEVNKTWETPR